MRCVTFPSQATNKRLILGEGVYYWAFDMPPSEQEIEVTLAGVIKRDVVKFPAMRVLVRNGFSAGQDTGNYLFTMHNGPETDATLQPFSMANVDKAGVICYGQNNIYPWEPFDAWTNFWQSTFNDHLMNHINFLSDQHLTLMVKSKGLINNEQLAEAQRKRESLILEIDRLQNRSRQIHEAIEETPIEQIGGCYQMMYDAAVMRTSRYEEMISEYENAASQHNRFRAAVASRKIVYLRQQYAQALQIRRLAEQRKESARRFYEDVTSHMMRRNYVQGMAYNPNTQSVAIDRREFMTRINDYAEEFGYDKMPHWKQVKRAALWRIVHRCVAYVLDNVAHVRRAEMDMIEDPIRAYIRNAGGLNNMAREFVEWWFFGGGWEKHNVRRQSPPWGLARAIYDLDKYDSRHFVFARVDLKTTTNQVYEIFRGRSTKEMEAHHTHFLPIQRNNKGFFYDEDPKVYYEFKVLRGRNDTWDVHGVTVVAKQPV